MKLAVTIEPGHTALTRMPSGASDLARFLARLVTAALDAV